MEISDEKVEKYREIYQKIYGDIIETERARDELTALVCLMNAVRNYDGDITPMNENDEENNNTN
jgi:hypothetical protein